MQQIFHDCFVVCRNFQHNCFSSKYISRKYIRVSTSLDPNQTGGSFKPDLGPNCLQRRSAYNRGKELDNIFFNNIKAKGQRFPDVLGL